MIFIGDGFTDIPSFSLVKQSGGHAIAVLDNAKSSQDKNLDQVAQLVNDGRVDRVSLGNHFNQDSQLEKSVFRIIDNLNNR